MVNHRLKPLSKRVGDPLKTFSKLESNASVSFIILKLHRIAFHRSARITRTLNAPACVSLGLYWALSRWSRRVACKHRLSRLRLMTLCRSRALSKPHSAEKSATYTHQRRFGRPLPRDLGLQGRKQQEIGRCINSRRMRRCKQGIDPTLWSGPPGKLRAPGGRHAEVTLSQSHHTPRSLETGVRTQRS